ncbi:solute carrier family 2, facilitated glucose transporter member 5 isoform X3 [Elephas maximus indicus]|uniref:solute carrier family 2, facilitated glucose transporter member 5 isoform X3 n=1 Tax=Elephas maximus indicus TaxID=99487 RepID=UPI0021162E7D|nr:solute carrier family 2, facilitated glucose transporter member 5 isoform X3 [Elephas maximus indicus]
MVRMEDRADCPLRFASLHPAEHQGKSWHSANRQERLTLILALATLIAAFGSSFQYGYNVAVINSPAEIMKQFYNDTNYERYGEYIPEVSLTLLWSVSVSMFPFGGFLGSLLVGPLVTRLGRKGTLLFNNIFSIVPAILMGCSKVAGSFEMIILSRLLVGICAGLSSNVVPMYLGELAPKNLRGALGVVPQLFITVGIFVAQIFGLRSLLATEEGWPILLGLTGVPAALQLALLPFFPESPRYLLVQKKDETAAKNDLLLCGPDLPQRRREGGRGPVRDGRHRGRQRGDDHLCCVCGGAAGQKTADPPRLLHLPHSLLRADRRPGTTGDSILDALHQHCLCHLLCHRTRNRAQSHSRTAHHRDLPAVLSASRLHGGGQRSLALQLHRGLGLPLHSGRPGGLQLHHFCRNMSSHHHLYLPGCPRDQGQDIYRDQSDFHQDK